MKIKKNIKIILLIASAVLILFLFVWGCSSTENKPASLDSENNSSYSGKDAAINGSVEMGFCKKIAVRGSLALALDSLYGLRMINLENPAEPVIESSIRAPQPNDLFLIDDTVYISDYIEGIMIFDITDFKNPVKTGQIKEPNQTFSIYCSNNYLFVTTQYTYYEKKYSNFIIYDISEKNSPEKISFFDHLPWINDIYVEGKYAYLAFDDAADNTTGLIIIDISDIYKPSLSGSLNTEGFALNLIVKNDMVFLADDRAGFKIIDAGNKKNPEILSTLSLENHTSDIALDGVFAYVADGYNGVKKISFENTGKPALIESINTLGFSRGLALDDKYIYIADGKYLTVAEKF